MRAIRLKQTADGSELYVTNRPEPVVGDHDILIEVRAASVNRADLLQRAGSSPVSTTTADSPVGLDTAGDVIAVGSGVAGLAVGDRVMSLVSGGLAERVGVDARLAMKIPSTWTYAEGAAAILGLAAEHHAIVTAGRFTAGESVLIHAASSGVGLQGVQLASYLGSSAVIATTRSDRGDDLLKSLGADAVLHPTSGSFADQVRAVTGGAGVDLIVDHVGGPYLQENVSAAALKARIVSVGRLGGGRGRLDLEAVAFKRLEIVGVTFRTRSPDEKAEILAGVAVLLSETDAAEALRPTVDRALDWLEVETAQAIMRASGHLGKIVLTVRQSRVHPDINRPGGVHAPDNIGTTRN